MDNSDYRRNLVGFTAVNAFWQVGSTFVLPNTSLIYFLNELNASNMAIGLVVPIFTIFSSVPCILWARVIRVDRRMRKLLAISCYLIFIPYLFVFVLMNFLNLSNTNNIVIICLLLILSNLALSYESVAYQNYVATVVPEKKRGTLWGIVFSFGYVISIITYPLMAYLDDKVSVYDFYKFGFLFFFGFAFLATQFIWMIKEPTEIKKTNLKENEKWGVYFKCCKEILEKDKNFRNFIFIQYFSNFSMCIRSFTLVYIINKFDISNTENIKYTIIYCIVFGFGSYVGGKTGDKKGFRFVFLMSMLFQSIGTILLLINTKYVINYIIYGLIVFSLSFQDLSVMNIPIDSTRDTNKSKYIGLSKTLVVPSLLISIFLGILVDKNVISFSGILIISSIILLFTFILILLFIIEPRNLLERKSK